MMNLRRASLVFGVLLSTGAVFVSAQAAPADQPSNQSQRSQGRSRGRHGMDPEKQTKMLTEKLSLSADQAAKITPILQDRAQQMQALRADTSVAPADRRTKSRSIMDESNSKIEAVLNDQQKQQFQQMQAERKGRRGSRKSSGGPSGGV